FLNGSGGADVANVDDSGDPTGRTGTLTASTLTGLGMGAAITYGGMTAMNINLGGGQDVFTISSTSCPTTVHGGSDNDMITLQATSVAGPTNLFGDNGNDQLTVDKLSVGQVSGPVNLDGGNGTDTDTVNITGAGGYVVNVTDTGAEPMVDS